jgi:hypothetical protein
MPANRPVAAALLASALIFGVVPFREHRTEAERLEFFCNKFKWGPEFDIVLAGDSRVLNGLSPAAMAPGLPGLRIANFAFGARGLEPRYLEAAARLLRADSRTRTIVVGISPRALTKAAVTNGEFEALSRLKGVKLLEAIYAEKVADHFSPLDIQQLSGAQRIRLLRSWLPDGWMSADMAPRLPTMQIKSYRTFFARSPVAPEIVDAVIATVAGWTARGIRVVGARLPSTPAMRALEDEVSGFDADTFEARLERAGGTWMDFPEGSWESFDGSHLTPASARVLSLELARRLRTMAP